MPILSVGSFPYACQEHRVMMDQLRRRRRRRRRVAWAASLLLLLPDAAKPLLIPLHSLSHDGLVAYLGVVRVHDRRNRSQYHHSQYNHRTATAGQDRWPFVVADDWPHCAAGNVPLSQCFRCGGGSVCGLHRRALTFQSHTPAGTFCSLAKDARNDHGAQESAENHVFHRP